MGPGPEATGQWRRDTGTLTVWSFKWAHLQSRYLLREKETFRSSSRWQPICSSLCQQDGGNSLTDSIPPSLQPVAVVPAEEHLPVSRAPSWKGKLNCRSGVQTTRVFSRVDAPQGSLLPDATNTGPMQDRPVSNQTETPTVKLHQLETRPVCSRNRYAPPRLEDAGRLCLSPILLHRRMPAENSPGKKHHNNSSTMVVLPSMVSSSAREPSRPSTTTPQSQRPADGPNSPLSTPRVPTTSQLQSIRGQYEMAGVSGKRATELLLTEWSKGTNTAHQSGWSRWTSWCSEWEMDPLSCGIQPFLDFLSDLFREGLKYRSINLIISAVSMTHNPIESIPIGQHPLVSRLMKGVYKTQNLRNHNMQLPGMCQSLELIKGVGRNEDISLKDLSTKLAVLMALVSANRTSEL